MEKTILSTKKLSPSQKEHLLSSGLGVVDANFIKTASIPFTCPNEVENAIFTSQSGVKAVFEKSIIVKNAYCVGKRTQRLLESLNIQVKLTAKNAAVLSDSIIKQASGNSFYYFCAKDRLNTLPRKLTEAKINWTEVPVYETYLTPKKYKQLFDSVLFYSPSGVKSYFSINKEPVHSFCIGDTTAKELKKYTKNYTVASVTTIENVLVKAIKYLKND